MISFLKLLTLGDSPVGKMEITDVNSIAELRAIKTGNNGYGSPFLEDGSIVNVDGYYSQNDGGGGVFIFSAYSVASDDGGLTIAPTSGLGRWIRQAAKQPVNVKWFGAVGDGVTDDTDAIQTALNSSANVIVIPPGTYKQTAALSIPANTTLQGAGYNATTLEQATAETNNINVYNVDGVKIKDLGINAVSAVAINVYANTSDVNDFLAENVSVNSLGTAGKGVYFQSSATHTVYFPLLFNVSVKGGGAASWGTKEGITIGSGGSNVLVVGTRIYGGRIWRCHHGINLNKCDSAQAFGVVMDDCDGIGVWFQNCGQCHFYGTRQEAGTFGKYAQFDGSENYFESTGLESATPSELTDNGIRNAWEGSNGAGGLLNKERMGPRTFPSALTLLAAINGMTIANGAPYTPRVNNPADSSTVPNVALGGVRNTTAPGPTQRDVSYNFPFTEPSVYLAVGVIYNGDGDIATRVSIIIEGTSGSFIEVNVIYSHPSTAVATFAFSRSSNDVVFAFTGGAAIATAMARSLIKLS